jgi:protein required for attachment to host cells
MAHTWIVVANSTRARIFEAPNNNDLKEIEEMSHPEGRLRNHELVSDRPGRTYESASTTRHAVEPKTNPQSVEFEHFADSLVDHLKKAHQEGKFKKLYLSATPAFLGMLRPKISREVASTIAAEYNVDLTLMGAAEIRKHLPYVL